MNEEDEEDTFESDGGPADEAYAGRLQDEARNEQAGREINALAKLRAAGLDPAIHDEEVIASVEGVGPVMAARLVRYARANIGKPYVFD